MKQTEITESTEWVCPRCGDVECDGCPDPLENLPADEPRSLPDCPVCLEYPLECTC
jgi:hypothetical protein